MCIQEAFDAEPEDTTCYKAHVSDHDPLGQREEAYIKYVVHHNRVKQLESIIDELRCTIEQIIGDEYEGN